MAHPKGYDEHREDERKNARAWCEKDVCYWPRCSCDNTAHSTAPNIQQLPEPSDEFKRIRKAFTG